MKTKTKTLTVSQLHKMLGKLIDQGHGRAQVCISKSTFTHPLESDGCSILNAYGIRIENVPQMDGDGWTEYTKSGRESTRRTAVLFGYDDDEWQYEDYPNQLNPTPTH